MRIYNRDQQTGRIKAGYTSLEKVERDSKFWENVEMIPFHSCWEWIGPKNQKGYGKFHIGLHRYAFAHRYSLGILEALDPKLVVDHICCNRSCVNPSHLRQVTAHQNTFSQSSKATAAINKLKTICKWGHEFTAENTGINLHGNRWCRACNRERSLKKWKN